MLDGERFFFLSRENAVQPWVSFEPDFEAKNAPQILGLIKFSFFCTSPSDFRTHQSCVSGSDIIWLLQNGNPRALSVFIHFTLRRLRSSTGFCKNGGQRPFLAFFAVSRRLAEPRFNAGRFFGLGLQLLEFEGLGKKSEDRPQETFDCFRARKSLPRESGCVS